MDQEIFKDIPNYEGLYQVSNLGKVKSLSRITPHSRYGFREIKTRILKPQIDRKGYYNVTLHYHTYKKLFKIHQLVAMAFLNHKPCGMETIVDHIDNNPLNNHVNNLHLISNRDNCIKEIKKVKGYKMTKNKTNPYQSKINVNGEEKYLGVYKTTKEANEAYLKAAKIYYPNSKY